MSLPCVCYRCSVCKELRSIKDPLCLSVEEKNCRERDCETCDFVCEGFTEKQEASRLGSVVYLSEV